jgi:hypothetical protein
MTQSHGKSGWPIKSSTALWALFLLSLLWACDTLQPTFLPNLNLSPRSSLARDALPLGFLAIVTGARSLILGRTLSNRTVPTQILPARTLLAQSLPLSSILLGLGLFALPILLMNLVTGEIPEFTRAWLLTLVPVFAVTFEPHLGGVRVRPVRGALFAALVAAIGGLLVFPVGLPATVPTALAFGLGLLVSIGIAAASCRGFALLTQAPNGAGQDTSSQDLTAAIAGSSAALTLAAAAALTRQWQRLTAADWGWALAVELPGLLLFFWLLPRLTASRLAARFVLAPLVAILAGAALLQAPLSLRTALGLLLMALGTAWLLFAHPEDSGTLGLSLY